MPLDVICPNCRGVFFETNDRDGFSPYVTGLRSTIIREYDPAKAANAAMINMKAEFLGVYDDILHQEDLIGEGIGPCPGCGGALSDDNWKFITKPQPKEADPLICEICDRGPFKTEQGKSSHMRQIHGG